MTTTPLSAVKDQFKSKVDLVSAVRALATDKLWIDRVNETKGLERVSNAKLLRLHKLLTDTKTRFGSRDTLIDTILTADKRPSDAGYKSRLESFPLPRLLDLHTALTRREKRSASAPKPAPKKKLARSKKAQAKAKTPVKSAKAAK